jgi:NADPH:quinone reductase-like Zn-dependent oxidoreductase
MKAVQFDEYGGIDALRIAEVPLPEPAQGEVQVKVRAAGVNPVEWKIRCGMFRTMMKTTFPAGQGTDFAGTVTKLGVGVSAFAEGEEVLGFTDRRASHAEYVVAGTNGLTRKPKELPWEVAGSLAMIGTTAYACVRAVSLQPGDTVAVSSAAGGVGSIAVQLARRSGATVIGIADAANHDWLRAHGAIPVAYGEGLAQRLADRHLDAFIDLHGGGYVKLAIELGVAAGRINTIVDMGAVQKYGVKNDGNQAARSAAVLAELAALVAAGQLEVPIAAMFPLDQVRAAFELLERGHTHGKIVLLP